MHKEATQSSQAACDISPIENGKRKETGASTTIVMIDSRAWTAKTADEYNSVMSFAVRECNSLPQPAPPTS